jgi:hypothetical protein
VRVGISRPARAAEDGGTYYEIALDLNCVTKTIVKTGG